MPVIAALKRLLRFALVGGAATLIYGMLSVLLARGFGLPAMSAHLLAYLLVIPLSFIGQNRITFGYTGDHGKAFGRFVITSLFALTLSTCAVWGLQSRGYADLYGTLATMIIVPVISYLMLVFWVFVERAEID